MNYDYEGLAETTKNLVFEVMIQLMIRRRIKTKQETRPGSVSRF